MKILYMIHMSHISSGLGGHWRSMRALVECMESQGHTCKILTMTKTGFGSPVISSMSTESTEVALSYSKYYSFRKSLGSILKEYCPDVVHCFDFNSYYHFLLSGVRKRYPVIMSKCGGPPCTRLLPMPEHVVIFSQEDLEWFGLNSPSKKKSNFHYIPNRVSRVTSDEVLSDSVRTQVDSEKVILQICRIGNHYENSIFQSLNLVRSLRAEGVNVKLALVGVVESEKVLRRVLDQGGDGLVVFSSRAYVEEASKILAAGDIIVGTGRGAMEAAMVGKPVLVPTKNTLTPILMQSSSFESLFRFNFSPRCQALGLTEPDNHNEVRACLSDPIDYQKLAKFSREVAEAHFSMDAAYTRYSNLYDAQATVSQGFLQPIKALKELAIIFVRKLLDDNK